MTDHAELIERLRRTAQWVVSPDNDDGLCADAASALTALVLIAVVLMPGPGEYMLVTGMHTALALLTAGVWAGSRTPQGARLTLPALLPDGRFQTTLLVCRA